MEYELKNVRYKAPRAIGKGLGAINRGAEYLQRGTPYVDAAYSNAVDVLAGPDANLFSSYDIDLTGGLFPEPRIRRRKK